MKIAEVRLKNLERLLRDYKYDKDFCQAVGISPTYLSQVRSRTKALGDNLVDRIEKALGLPAGHMDSATAITEESSENAVMSMAHAIQSLQPGVRTTLAALVYELARSNMAGAPAATFDKIVPDTEAHDAQQSPAVPATRRR